MNMFDRLANLDSAISENRLLRRQWKDPGRNMVCLLAALSPEAGEQETSSACPASVMPQWLANLTPWIDDVGSDEAWPEVIRRYAAVAHTWGDWSPETWERKHYQIRAAFVREAMRHTQAAKVLWVCEMSAGLCEKRGQGGKVSQEEWAAAAEAAEAALSASLAAEAALSASLAAEAAQEAAQEAARATAWAALSGARAATGAAEEAAEEARAAKGAAEAARAAARAAAGAAETAAARAAETAADRMIEAVLSILGA